MKIFERPRPAIDRLRALRLLEAATDKELDHIDRMMCEVDVSAGRVLTREGRGPQGFFLIVAGCAVLTVAGRERGVLDAGAFFGETALLNGGPEPATVTALTAMQLRVATSREFAQLRELPPLTWPILQTFAVRQHPALDDRARVAGVPATVGAAG